MLIQVLQGCFFNTPATDLAADLMNERSGIGIEPCSLSSINGVGTAIRKASAGLVMLSPLKILDLPMF